jgi:energy-coupling factor transport system permease protein
VTAALATRMVPVLARDAQRLADAARARAGAPPSRLVLVRAVAASTMDRAIDVAATLETRGYGNGGRAPALQRAWSRHDAAFGLSALALFALAYLGHHWAPFDAFPALSVPLDAGVVAAAALIAGALLAPFADRRGV